MSHNDGLSKPQIIDYEHATTSEISAVRRLNRTQQTVEYVRAQQAEYGQLNRLRMGVWEALDVLNHFMDINYPKQSLSDMAHALQTAELIRQAGTYPDWFILAGLIHDLGKMLYLFGEPQWAVVSDIYPLGCRFSDKIANAEFFAANPDSKVQAYQTVFGIYAPNCGLHHVLMSWGHCEYLYEVVKHYLPKAASFVIRYHSFHVCHEAGAYRFLMNDEDKALMDWVKTFHQFDLHTKQLDLADPASLKPYYQELIARYFPDQIAW